jgi:hypothetical protein
MTVLVNTKRSLTMTKAMRWRIIVLQVVALLVLIGAAGGAYYGSSFTTDQIKQQLAPQQIFFPASAAQGLPSDLQAYAGQQVLTGDQAHAYAEKFIALHLQEIGQGHPYSYWSGVARSETNKVKAAQDQAIADTLFKGETLRSMLNQAWTFSVFAQLAFYAALGLAIAGLVVLGALVFEVLEAVRGIESVPMVRAAPTPIPVPALS